MLRSDANLRPAQIDVIGFHGQALVHRPPNSDDAADRIGTAAWLAVTGIDVVNDFRTRRRSRRRARRAVGADLPRGVGGRSRAGRRTQYRRRRKRDVRRRKSGELDCVRHWPRQRADRRLGAETHRQAGRCRRRAGGEGAGERERRRASASACVLRASRRRSRSTGWRFRLDMARNLGAEDGAATLDGVHGARDR